MSLEHHSHQRQGTTYRSFSVLMHHWIHNHLSVLFIWCFRFGPVTLLLLWQWLWLFGTMTAVKKETRNVTQPLCLLNGHYITWDFWEVKVNTNMATFYIKQILILYIPRKKKTGRYLSEQQRPSLSNSSRDCGFDCCCTQQYLCRRLHSIANHS